MTFQPEPIFGDIQSTGTLGSLTDIVALEMNGVSGAKAVVSGTWVGTIKFQQTIDGSRWDPAGSFDGTTGAIVSSTGITSNTIVALVGVAGVFRLRAVFTSYTSGTATVIIRGSNGVSNVFVDNLVPSNFKVQSYENDGSGNALTSQVNGTQRALDVGIDVAGVQIDPRQIRTLTSSDIVTADQGNAPWSQNITQIAGNSIATAASGIAKIGLTDGSGNAVTSTVVNSKQALDVSVVGGTITESTAAWTSSTAVNSAVTMTVTGYTSVFVTLNQGSTITGGVVTFEVSDTTGFTNAYPVTAALINDPDFGTTYTLVASTNQAFYINVRGATAFRVRLSTVISGTGTVNVGVQANSLPGDPIVSGEVNSELYDAAGNGITSTLVSTKQALDIDIAASADGAAALANQVFTTSFNFNLPTGGTESAAAFLKNPNGSGKTLVIKRIHVNNVGQGNFQALINIYSDPTSSANGTAQSATTTSIGSGSTAVATPFSGPTVSANGARLYSESIGSGNQATINNPLNFDGLIRIVANHTLLITGIPNSNNSNVAFTIMWQEV